MENIISPVSHVMISWLGATYCRMERRERLLISIAGFSPDFDGVGLAVDVFLKLFGIHTHYWGKYHHSLHSFFFAVFISLILALAFTRYRVKVFCGAFIAFNVHLLCDLVGSKGPDGYQWPIPYFSPFSEKVQLVWQWQWELVSWQNLVIAFLLIALIIRTILLKKISPLELMSTKLDTTLVAMICGKKP